MSNIYSGCKMRSAQQDLITPNIGFYAPQHLMVQKVMHFWQSTFKHELLSKNTPMIFEQGSKDIYHCVPIASTTCIKRATPATFKFSQTWKTFFENNFT